jgi:hypothetical protein
MSTSARDDATDRLLTVVDTPHVSDARNKRKSSSTADGGSGKKSKGFSSISTIDEFQRRFKMTVSVSEPTFSISPTYKSEKVGSVTETVILNLRWNSSIVDILENPLDFLPMNLLLWLTTKTEFIFIMSVMCLELIVEAPSNFSLNPMERLFVVKKYID